MKKFALIFALSLGMISCSDKSSSSSDTTSEKQLSTIEEYTEATLDLMEEVADVIESTTPANSAAQAKKLEDVVARANKINKEAEKKFGKAKWDAIGEQPEIKTRVTACVQRIIGWSVQNGTALQNGEFSPSFIQALENMENL